MRKSIIVIACVLLVLGILDILAAFFVLGNRRDENFIQYQSTNSANSEVYNEEQRGKNEDAILSSHSGSTIQGQIRSGVNLSKPSYVTVPWLEESNRLADQQVERFIQSNKDNIVQAPIPTIKRIDTGQIEADNCINLVNVSMYGSSELVKAIERQNCILRYQSR